MNNQASLVILVRRYITSAGPAKKQMLDDILAFPSAEIRIFDAVFGADQRACLRVLADAGKKKRIREALKPLVIKNIDRLLAISDDKARKTACNLIGTCAPNECADKLKAALNREKTRFVRPSIILALGNTQTPSRYLKSYTVEPGDPKHVKEEGMALKKALAKEVGPAVHAKVKRPDIATITSINRKALAAELEAYSIECKPSAVFAGAFEVPTKEIGRLRCFAEALYYIGSTRTFEKAAQTLDRFGCRSLRYRIEAGQISTDQRREIIETVSGGLAEFGYVDNPSSYSFEIRVQKQAMFAVFFGDERFRYRKQSISASINPVTAASVMRICMPYMKADAVVLDPFCGSATMLIERSFVKKPSKLIGVDISPVAIKAACANRKTSGLRMSLIKDDILGYSGIKYDEIVANMPFGIRVSDHAANIALYQSFIDKLPALLMPDGVAFLYTQEKKLLRSIVAAKPGFAVEKEEKFESGGLSPTLFIIKRSS